MTATRSWFLASGGVIAERLAIAVLLAALGAGCDRGSQPATGHAPGPTSTSVSPTSASPTSTPHGPGAPTDAARAYIAAYNAAAQHADTSSYDRIVAPGCACREPFLSSFVGSLRRHHWHTDARRVITSVQVVRRAGTGAIVDVAFRVDGYRVLDARDHTVMPGAPDTGVLRISLVRSDARWVVADAVRR